MIGLGLYPKMISLEAVEILREVCDHIFYEEYTSIPSEGCIEDLERLVGKKFKMLSRRDIEDLSGLSILRALEKGSKVCLASWGDPLAATTHISLVSRVIRSGFRFKYIPGVSSITVALSSAGLMIYRLGKIATITYPKNGILSEYPYLVLSENLSRNLHTLYLLDLDVEKGVYMSFRDALNILLELESRFKKNLISENSYVIGLNISSKITLCGGSVIFMKSLSLDRYPQILIVPAKLYFTEEEYLDSLGLRENRCVEV